MTLSEWEKTIKKVMNITDENYELNIHEHTLWYVGNIASDFKKRYPYIPITVEIYEHWYDENYIRAMLN